LGTVTDESMGDAVTVTIIATGFANFDKTLQESKLQHVESYGFAKAVQESKSQQVESYGYQESRAYPKAKVCLENKSCLDAKAYLENKSCDMQVKATTVVDLDKEKGIDLFEELSKVSQENVTTKEDIIFEQELEKQELERMILAQKSVPEKSVFDKNIVGESVAEKIALEKNIAEKSEILKECDGKKESDNSNLNNFGDLGNLGNLSDLNDLDVPSFMRKSI